MTMMSKEAPERQDIEALLPWHAAGTLSRRDSERVERAIASDRELARRFDLVREELSETIHLNESLGAPSARAMEKLFAAIEAEAPAPRKSSFDLLGRVAEFISSFSPRTLALAGSAAAVAVVLQAAVLATVVVRDQGGQEFSLASHSTGDAKTAMVRFTPQARSDEITRFLTLHHMVVVGGPKKGNLYEVQLAATAAHNTDFAKVVQQMKAETRIVEFIATKN
jgi:anti-sigma-K factor RskA